MTRFGALVFAFICAPALTACDGGAKSEPSKQEPVAEAAAKDGESKAAEAKAEVAKAAEAAPTDAAPEGPSSSADPNAIDESRFPTPAWFKPDVLPLSQVKSQGRSAPDASGFFASNMVLVTQVDLTPQKCIEALKHQIGAAITDWKEPVVTDDRVTVRGVTERYDATLVCGKVKNKDSGEMQTTASVNYRWTK
jgi:hypothetical protein